MSKFLQILLVAAFTIALCHAEAPRYRAARFQSSRRNRLARQEVAEAAAVTPYPSADELKPEVAFDEVAAAADAADEEPIVHQPDETYGPPEVEADEAPEEEQPAVESAQPEEEEVAVEDEVAIAEEEAAAAEDDAAIEAELDAEVAAEQAPEQVDEQFAPEEVTEEPKAERLVFGRRIAGRRNAARPAKLRAAAPRAARLQQARPQFVAQPYFLTNGPFAYTAQVQQW